MLYALLLVVLFASVSSAFVPRTARSSTLARSKTLLWTKKTAIIAGATGYIGKSVVRESVLQGYQTIALVRNADKLQSSDGFEEFFEGAVIVECDVCDEEQVKRTVQGITDKFGPVDAIVSCLASRSGLKKDSYRIDYQATLNCLEAGRAAGAKHFVMLSAFCVRKPLLQFQHAKLKFEAELQAQTDMTWSIVRPTAFFKSVSGQLDRLQSGASFLLYKGGENTACNPIAESCLARFMMNCVTDKSCEGKIMNVGGPDGAITKKMQGEMMFRALGLEPSFSYGPSVRLVRVLSQVAQFLHTITRWDKFDDAAEAARIIRYYMAEDMLTTSPSEKYGSITLQEHYNRIAVEGMEYDPYVQVLVNKQKSNTADAFQKWIDQEDKEESSSATRRESFVSSR